MLLKKQWVNDEIKQEIRKYLETNDNENTALQNLRCSKSNPKREVDSDTGFPQQANKQNLKKKPNLTTT